jgi:hypothetical protein
MYCNTRTILDPASFSKRRTCYQLFVLLFVQPLLDGLGLTQPDRLQLVVSAGKISEPKLFNRPPTTILPATQTQLSASASGCVFVPPVSDCPAHFIAQNGCRGIARSHCRDTGSRHRCSSSCRTRPEGRKHPAPEHLRATS